MQIINVKEEMRLDALLLREFPVLKAGELFKYMRENKIKVNKKKVSLSSKVEIGDVVQLYIKKLDELNSDVPIFMLSRKSLDIVFEDSNVILVNKPSGLIVQDESGKNPDTLINRVLHYLHSKGDAFDEKNIKLCHRLDTGTSGLTILVKNSDALLSITDAIKQRQTQKKYLCVVCKALGKNQNLRAYLLKNAKEGTVRIFDNRVKNSKEIITEFKVLENIGDLSLLEVKLITGRTHQIRAHLAHISAPILGDSKYGILQQNRHYKTKYQLLCAYSIEFNNVKGACEYLNGKQFKVQKPWFVQKFLNGELV